MKLIRTEDAVGQVLCHDITQIIKGVTKDAVFRKGHIIREEDIPVLLSVGKEHLYIWENNENMLHENEAAEILRDICQGDYMHASEAKEGKIELIADRDGLLMVDLDGLRRVNSLGEMMIATQPSGFVVKVRSCAAHASFRWSSRRKKCSARKKRRARSRSFSCIRSRKRPLVS